MRIAPAIRAPSETAEIQAQLSSGKLKVAGLTIVDGRKAIKLTSIHGPYEYDVAPGTYDPIRQVVRSRAITVTTTYSEYRVLPATTTNQRLLNLAALHATARVDRSHADYETAQARLLKGS